jgi:hypothetical protein
MLHAGRTRQARQFQRGRQIGGDWLLAVDMLAGGDRLANTIGAHGRGLSVEVDRVVGVGQALGQVGAPALDAVCMRQRAQLGLTAPNQHRVGIERVAIGKRHAALFADADDRANQVLVGAHSPGYAIHDDADSLLGH